MSDLFTRMWITLGTRVRRDEGQTMVEYAVVLSLIVVAVAAVALTGAAGQLQAKIDSIITSING